MVSLMRPHSRIPHWSTLTPPSHRRHGRPAQCRRECGGVWPKMSSAGGKTTRYGGGRGRGEHERLEVKFAVIQRCTRIFSVFNISVIANNRIFYHARQGELPITNP